MRGLILWALASLPVSGLIFREGAGPAANTETAPTGDYSGSGWQHQLIYAGFHGTIISPKHFITAVHIGFGSPVVTQQGFFNGVGNRSFTVKGSRRVGQSDFRIFEIWETFDDFALLYNKADENGKEVVIHGRGFGAGSEISGRGWNWGGGSTQRSRWGRNTIEDNFTNGSNNLLHFDFSDVLGEDEVMVANRDSGGGWFIKDGDTWKLAAVTFAVDTGYSTAISPSDATRFNGALYDADRAWIGSDAGGWNRIPSSGSSNDPTNIRFYRQSNGYGSRVSASATSIQTIIDPAIAWQDLDATERMENWLGQFGVTSLLGSTDDADADGLTNLEEYLTESDPSDSGERVKPMTVEYLPDGSHRVTLVESLDLVGRGLTVVVESSDDLSTWQLVNDLSELSNDPDSSNGIRTRILTRTPTESGALYYRLRIVLEAFT